jgi:hypothetical protein
VAAHLESALFLSVQIPDEKETETAAAAIDAGHITYMSAGEADGGLVNVVLARSLSPSKAAGILRRLARKLERHHRALEAVRDGGDYVLSDAAGVIEVRAPGDTSGGR